MYAEKYHYYNNSTGAGYHNRQIMITTTSDNKVLQVTELLVNYDNYEVIHVSVNQDVEDILHQIANGDLEPSTPDGFIRVLMLTPDKIKLRQDLYDKGLSLQQDYSLAP